MSLTVKEARADMVATITTAWVASPTSVDIPIKYPDWKGTFVKPKSGPWANVIIQHVTGGKASLTGGDRTSMYDRGGLLTVELYTVPNDGLSTADDLVKIIMDALDGKLSSGGINFNNVSPNEMGLFEAWEQTNILAEFSYIEVK